MPDSIWKSIGAQAPSGTERFRIYDGAVLFDGTTGATPVSGAGTRLMWIPAKAAIRAGLVTGALWNDADVGSRSVGLGYDARASGTDSVALGYSPQATASYSIAIGFWASASGEGAVCLGNGAASGKYSLTCGYQAAAPLRSQMAAAGAYFATNGDAQRSNLSLMRSSTDAGAVELTLDGTAPAAGTRLTIASGKLYRFRIELSCICTAGTNIGACATWSFNGAIKNIGGTTALVGVPNMTDSFIDAALAAASVVLAADDPNDALTVTCTGIVGGAANTFHWHAAVYLSEVA